MKKRIAECLDRCRRQGRPALIVYATVGCPDPASGELLIDRLIEVGADMIELGVPFSDPMADGPVIQKASQMALAAGITFPQVLETAARLRSRHPETPLVLFSYYNVLFHYGLERLGAAIASAGIDGVLVVDLPLEERDELDPVLRENGIDRIGLVSPATSPERAARIAAGGSGFIYCITVRGVTGVRSELPRELAVELEQARKSCGLPVAAGFGISTPEMAVAVGRHADAVVVGSAMVSRVVAGEPDRAVELIGEIAAGLRAADSYSKSSQLK